MGRDRHLEALRHREVNGGSGQVDVALYEAIFAMMESLVPEFDVFGFIRERTGTIMPGITNQEQIEALRSQGAL